jgi:hypothetical protein
VPNSFWQSLFLSPELITLLGWRFLRTGGVEMTSAMENPTAAHTHERHEHHDHSDHQHY